MIIIGLPLTCIILQLFTQGQVTAQKQRHANAVFEVHCYDQSDCVTPGWVCDHGYCTPPSSCGPCEVRNRKGQCKSVCRRGMQCVNGQCTRPGKRGYCQNDQGCPPSYTCVYHKCVKKDHNVCAHIGKCYVLKGSHCEYACTKGGEYCDIKVGCVCEYGLKRNSSGLCAPINPVEYRPDDIPVPDPRHSQQYPGPKKNVPHYPEPKHNFVHYPEPKKNVPKYPAHKKNAPHYPEPRHNFVHYPEPTKPTNHYPEPNHHVQYPEPNSHEVHYPEPTKHSNQYPEPGSHNVQYPEPSSHNFQYPEPTVQYPYPDPTIHYPEPTSQTHHYPEPSSQTHYPEPSLPTHYPEPSKPEKCYSDYDCSEGHKCIETECIPECTSHDHCFPGKKCIKNRCTCSDDKHCGTSMRCDTRIHRCYEPKTTTKPRKNKKKQPKLRKQCGVCEKPDASGKCIYQCDYDAYEVCDDVRTKKCVCLPNYTRIGGKCVRDRRRPRRPKNKKQRKQRRPRPRQQRPRQQRRRQQQHRENNKINWRTNIKLAWKKQSSQPKRRGGFVERKTNANDLFWTVSDLEVKP